MIQHSKEISYSTTESYRIMNQEAQDSQRVHGDEVVDMDEYC